MRRELLYPAIEDEPTAYDFLSPAQLVRARCVNLPIYLAEDGPGQSTSLIDATIAELCRPLPAAATEPIEVIVSKRNLAAQNCEAVRSSAAFSPVTVLGADQKNRVPGL